MLLEKIWLGSNKKYYFGYFYMTSYFLFALKVVEFVPRNISITQNYAHKFENMLADFLNFSISQINLLSMWASL